MRKIIIGATLAAALVLPLGGVSAKAEKQALCHQKGNGDYVVVSVKAGKAHGHMKHGDFEPQADGTCVAPAPEPEVV
jgi:hypothetical protein